MASKPGVARRRASAAPDVHVRGAKRAWTALAYAAGLAVAGVLVWATGLDGVFLYDDYDSIVLNSHIRRLWPLTDAMSRPLADSAETVSTRPLLSLTFALDYALHGLDVTGYHVVNVAVHVASALLLFAFVRRTLALAAATGATGRVAAPRVPAPHVPAPRVPAPQPAPRPLLGGRVPDPEASSGLAFAIALLWMLHPLHTSSVTYVVQRAEALGGLFLLAALYCALRAASPMSEPHVRARDETGGVPLAGSAGAARWWTAGAVAACWLGAGAKETIAAAPLLAVVHHATFLDGSHRAALRRRWPLYAAMATSWLALAWLLSSDTGELAGEGRGVAYLLAQPGVMLRYVRLVLWPAPLAMTYDWAPAGGVADVAAPLLAVGALLAATAWGVARKRWWGFAGAAWFAILAPSSSVFGLTQRIMEHRTYLPAAVVVALAVLGTDALVRRLRVAREREIRVALLAAAAVALAAVTVERNRDYASEVPFWEENVSVQPTDTVAHLQLGRALLRAGDAERARASFERSIELGEPFAPAHNDLGRTLIALGDLDGADAELARALALDPELAVAHSNAALVAERRGDLDAATERYRRALSLDGSLDVARENLARVLARRGGHDEAAALLGLTPSAGEQMEPAAVARTVSVAGALERDGSLGPALALYERAAAAAPRDVAALNAWATALARAGRDEEALRRFVAVLALDPHNLDAHRNLGALHASRGRARDAVAHFERALAARPDAALVHFNLGLLAESEGDTDGALEHYEREVALNASFAPAHVGYARVLELRGRHAEAARHYETALKLSPDIAEARAGLERARAQAGAGS